MNWGRRNNAIYYIYLARDLRDRIINFALLQFSELRRSPPEPNFRHLRGQSPLVVGKLATATAEDWENLGSPAPEQLAIAGREKKETPDGQSAQLRTSAVR